MPPDISALSLAEVRKRFLGRKATPGVLSLLASDARRGVRHVYQVLKNRAEEEKKERRRIAGMLRLERGYWKTGCLRLAGVDEAGIGPLAGPVVAAAVVFAPGTKLMGVDDSKKLPAERRAELAAQIFQRASGVGVGLASVEEIDEINIYHAGLLAMKRALASLPFEPDHILTDARLIPGVTTPQNGIKGGDACCFSIAAASIVAKTHRDALMQAFDLQFPNYGFGLHKGYSTPDHQAALRRHGPSPLHRRSFLFVNEACGDCSPLFYLFLKELYGAASVPALTRLEEQWEQVCGELSGYEQRKFNQRMIRRKKRLAAELTGA
jgi:ribonuclease HII